MFAMLQACAAIRGRVEEAEESGESKHGLDLELPTPEIGDSVSATSIRLPPVQQTPEISSKSSNTPQTPRKTSTTSDNTD